MARQARGRRRPSLRRPARSCGSRWAPRTRRRPPRGEATGSRIRTRRRASRSRRDDRDPRAALDGRAGRPRRPLLCAPWRPARRRRPCRSPGRRSGSPPWVAARARRRRAARVGLGGLVSDAGGVRRALEPPPELLEDAGRPWWISVVRSSSTSCSGPPTPRRTRCSADSVPRARDRAETTRSWRRADRHARHRARAHRGVRGGRRHRPDARVRGFSRHRHDRALRRARAARPLRGVRIDGYPADPGRRLRRRAGSRSAPSSRSRWRRSSSGRSTARSPVRLVAAVLPRYYDWGLALCAIALIAAAVQVVSGRRPLRPLARRRRALRRHGLPARSGPRSFVAAACRVGAARARRRRASRARTGRPSSSTASPCWPAGAAAARRRSAGARTCPLSSSTVRTRSATADGGS